MSFHSADKPISLPLKRNDANNENKSMQSLLDLCKETTPPCKLNPLLWNGHLQTFWTATNSYDIPITYKRKIFTSDSTTYPGTFAVDFAVPTENSEPAVDSSLPPRTTYYEDAAFSTLGSDDERPMLIVLHGLAGGSNEIYLRSVLKPLCLDPSVSERWEACVINARGCAMSKITSGVLYNARATWDVRQFARWAREKWPQRKLFGCGFSLGANILVNVCSTSSVRSNGKADGNSVAVLG
jgi:predicted alpha/beta-fold hydrolase